MSLIYQQKGNVLTADVEAIVNAVNCVGIMGKGLALQFKQAYPENFHAYAVACRRSAICLGEMFITDTKKGTGPKYIINFPTKQHWKDRSHLCDIQEGLQALVADMQRLQIQSIALPALGCGLGGLRWCDVKPLIATTFAEFPNVCVQVFEPQTS